MYRSSSIIGVIPARGGSKGLPGKNIRPMCGKPLIGWSIERARQSALLDEIMVSTDCEDIAKISRELGAAVPFLRPAEFALDTSPTIDAILHALDRLEAEGRRFDYLCLLEPTSPLREAGDIDGMITRLINQAAEFDAIVSLGEVHHHPSIMKRTTGSLIEPYVPGLAAPSRRQDADTAWFPFGVAYIVKTATLRAERSFYPRRTTWFGIKRYQGYEIDDIYDFLAIESIMRHEWGLT